MLNELQDDAQAYGILDCNDIYVTGSVGKVPITTGHAIGKME